MTPPDAAEPPRTPRRARGRHAWDRALHQPLALDGKQDGATHGDGIPEAWFLGPRAENAGILHELVAAAIDSHAEFRRQFHPEDPSHLTEAIRHSPGYRDGIDRLRSQTAELLAKLRLSAPFASMRYQGHMLWDQALPATIGLFAAGLYNQNNVAAEASPVTTRLEIEVGNDLCRLLGYPVPDGMTPDQPGALLPWGHITSGGTVANIEALWAARNLKYAGVALKAAIREVPLLAPARSLEVPLWSGQAARLVELDTWTLLNLDLDVLAGLPLALATCGIDLEAATQALAGYAVENVGLIGFYRNFMGDLREPPVLLAPATGHYSWPKAATVLGLGQNAVLSQRVDMDARLDLEHVDVTLDQLLRARTPVLAAVAVIGSTEESAVDPIAGLIALRDRYRARGLNFAIHADAAWGGYFRSMLRPAATEPEHDDPIPVSTMSDYVRAQYEALPGADSITVDPHKGGYVPYPAGALCYRNAAFRDAVSLRAPVIFHSQTEPSVGVYGIEGSKPGSAAASVWLAHRVIRPDRSGYGRILGQCMWTARRLFCRLASLDDPRFAVTMFNRTPAERRRAPPEALATERATLRHFSTLGNEALIALLRADPAAKALFRQIGSDQVILAFALNSKHPDGSLNADLAVANDLNERVFGRCSLVEPRADMNEVELILTSSRFQPATYGQWFIDRFCRRMGVVATPGHGVDFLISTTMDPWTTEADGTDFLAIVVEALRRAAHDALDAMAVDAIAVDGIAVTGPA